MRGSNGLNKQQRSDTPDFLKRGPQLLYNLLYHPLSILPPKMPAVTSSHGRSNAHINLISSVDGSWMAGGCTQNLLQSKHPLGWLWTLTHLPEGTDCQRNLSKGRQACGQLHPKFTLTSISLTVKDIKGSSQVQPFLLLPSLVTFLLVHGILL